MHRAIVENSHRHPEEEDKAETRRAPWCATSVDKNREGINFPKLRGQWWTINYATYPLPPAIQSIEHEQCSQRILWSGWWTIEEVHEDNEHHFMIQDRDIALDNKSQITVIYYWTNMQRHHPWRDCKAKFTMSVCLSGWTYLFTSSLDSFVAYKLRFFFWDSSRLVNMQISRPLLRKNWINHSFLCKHTSCR